MAQCLIEYPSSKAKEVLTFSSSPSPILTMGACFSQGSRRLHERLDEYDDDYFLEDEDRRVEEERSTWLEENTIGSTSENFSRMHSNPPEYDWTIPASESEPPATTDSFEDITFSLSSPSGLQDSSIERNFYLNSFSNDHVGMYRQEAFWAGRNSGWYDKQKGRALQLRLRNHRFLQMAVTGQPIPCNNPTTPATVGSDFFSDGDATSLISDEAQDFPGSLSEMTPTPIAKSAEKTLDLNRQHGLIWKEISCTNIVSAVALNRIQIDLSSSENYGRTSDPLLLAMGDEKGKIAITQIIDDNIELGDDHDGGRSVTECKMDLGSEAVEFSIEGKVRSLDFGTYEHLVAGGDGCYAWVLQIILDTVSRIPRDVVVIHKLERIDRIYAVRFSCDQKLLAVGGFDGKVALVPMTTVWDKGEQEKEYDSDDSLSVLLRDSVIELDRQGLVYCLDWSPSGDYLAIAGSDKVCGIYNASNFNQIHETAHRSATIQDLRWSNDGKYLAMGDREVAIFRGEPPFKLQREISHTSSASAMAQFRHRVMSLCWSPTDSYLAIGGSDGRCLLIETRGWALIYEHHGMTSINSLAWGHQVYNSNSDIRRYLVLSDAECNVALIKAGVEPQSSDKADDNQSVASSSYQSESTLNSDWVMREDEFRDMDDVKEKATPELKSRAIITTIAFSKAGKSNKTSSYLAYAAEDCSLTIVRTRDWKTVFQVEFAKPIRSLAFSNSNNYLAMGGDEGILNVLSVRSRTIILNSILSSPIKSIAFSKNDERLGVGLEDGILTLLSPESNWESVGEIEQSDSCITCQDWDSKMFACGRINGSVTLFETDKIFDNFFVPLKEFTSKFPIRSVSFGSNGKSLAIGGDNGVVSVLNGSSGWTLIHLITVGYSIFSVKWSPAGRYLTLASAGTTCSVYDTTSWAAVQEVDESVSSRFTDDETLISCLAWSIDSKWMAMGGTGSGVHILDTSTWEFIEQASSVPKSEN